MYNSNLVNKEGEYMENSHIYVLSHCTEPLVKIGKANRVHKRVQGLGTANFDIERSFAYKVGSEQRAFNFEKALHNVFADRRASKAVTQNCVTSNSGLSEWFSITPLEARKVCDSLSEAFGAEPVEVRINKTKNVGTDLYQNKAFLQERLDTLLQYEKVLNDNQYLKAVITDQDSVIEQLRVRIQGIA